jgi:hypothetical protein
MAYQRDRSHDHFEAYHTARTDAIESV